MAELVKITTRINPDDRDTIRQFFPNHPYQEVMRQMIHKWCKKLRAKELVTMTIEEMPEIEIGGPS